MSLLAQVDPSTLDLSGAAKLLLNAVSTKNWWLVTGLVVWLLVTLLRKYGAAIPLIGKYVGPFLALKWSGPFLAILFSVGGGLITLALAGQGPSLAWFLSILGSAAGAVFTQEVQQKAREAASGASAAVKTAEDADAVLKGGK